MFKLLFQTGIRASELINFKHTSIRYDQKVASVYGKGGKTREINLGEDLCEDIKVYLKKRKLPNHSEHSYLFLNPSGKRLCTNTPRFHLKKIIKLLGW